MRCVRNTAGCNLFPVLTDGLYCTCPEPALLSPVHMKTVDRIQHPHTFQYPSLHWEGISGSLIQTCIIEYYFNQWTQMTLLMTKLLILTVAFWTLFFFSKHSNEPNTHTSHIKPCHRFKYSAHVAVDYGAFWSLLELEKLYWKELRKFSRFPLLYSYNPPLYIFG